MKKIILFFLLLTTTITKSTLDIDLHIKNLNDAHLKKLQELSEISKQIAEKHAFLLSLAQQGIDIAGSQEEFDAKLEESSLKDFLEKFKKACEKKDLKGVLTDGFLDNYNTLNFFKVLIVRSHFESLLIVKLIEKYEKCLQEFIEISDNRDCLV